MCSALLGHLGLDTILWCNFLYNAQGLIGGLLTLFTGVLALVAAGLTVRSTLRSAEITAEATLRSAAMMMAQNSQQIAEARAEQEAKGKLAKSAAAKELRGRLIALKDCIDPNRRPSRHFLGRAADLFGGVEAVRLADSIDQVRLIGGVEQQEYIEIMTWVEEVLQNAGAGSSQEKFLAEGIEFRERADALAARLNALAEV
jgi:hypothetical protein